MSVQATDVAELSITSGDDVVRVRRAVRARALAVKLSLVDQTKLVTAASELARNTLVHASSGPGAPGSARCSPTPGPASPTSTWP